MKLKNWSHFHHLTMILQIDSRTVLKVFTPVLRRKHTFLIFWSSFDLLVPTDTSGAFVSVVSVRHCVCRIGYEGVNCERPIDGCAYRPSICLNNGICRFANDSFSCYCGPSPSGVYFTGKCTNCRAKESSKSTRLFLNPLRGFTSGFSGCALHYLWESHLLARNESLSGFPFT